MMLILVLACGNNVGAVPVPDFSGTPTAGPASLPVDFTDESTGDPAGWAWYFGEETCAGTWTQMTGAAGWSARNGHAVVTLPDGSVVLTGGVDSPWGWRNDAWRSTDQGTTWTQMTAAGGWPTRYFHVGCVLADGSIVIAGGWGDGSPGRNLNDVWRSTDQGATWTQMTAAAGWTARHALCAVALADGSMVIAGGQGAGEMYGDVWRSTDQGATWTQMTAAAWPGRIHASCVALPGGRILVMGGIADDGQGKNEIWASDDQGATWAELVTQNPWTARSAHAATVLPDGSIVVMGGTVQVGGSRINDVWRSRDDGVSWTRDRASAEWDMRYRHAATVLHDGSILLIGGDSGMGWRYNDVWRLPTAGSNLQSPSHTYTAEGSFQVSLQAYDATGKAAIRKADYITVTGVVHVIAVSADPPEGGTVSGGGNFAPDDEVTVLATANPGYIFVNWTESGAPVSTNASYTFTATASRTLVANFALAPHTVVFRTDGTEGATVNGAATVTQLVLDGEDCAGVLAAAPDGYDFLGWTGGYVGPENPLTVTNVTADLTITANFAMQQVAVGSIFEVDAANLDGLPPPGRFLLQPKAYALHDLNGKVGSKASVKVLDKVDKVNGTETVRCEWTKRLRLYDVKAFKAAEKGGIGAAEWITPTTMRDLPMELHVVSKEAVPPDQDIQPLALAVPVIDDVRIGEPDAKGNPTIMIVGKWFGAKKPKVWREYTVPGKAEGAVVIKRQGLKVVKPTVDNTEYRDSKGKPACMDPATGESKVIVLAPSKDPKGVPNGTIVLDNGVGLAAGPDLSVGVAWTIGTGSNGGAVIFGTSNGGLSWQVQVPGTAYPGHNGNDISAVDELTAWAALSNIGVDGGIILHTADGGITWTPQDLPEAVPSGIKGIKGVSRDEAWAVGLAGPVLHTLDGGETWTVVPTDGITIVQVNRMDVLGDDIWIADVGNGEEGMIHSSDGGATWRREFLPEVDHGHGPMTVSIVDADTAWSSVNMQGDLYRTTNGGDTWLVAADRVSGPNDIDDVCAIAADQAWAVQNISGSSAGHVMFVTLAAADPVTESWSFPDYVYEGVAAVDRRTAWVAGFRTVGASAELPMGSVRRTVNGNDWSQLPMPDPDAQLWKISVVGARR
jgi:uncharacterized repeat protein (TIGR02543 family)